MRLNGSMENMPSVTLEISDLVSLLVQRARLESGTTTCFLLEFNKTRFTNRPCS